MSDHEKPTVKITPEEGSEQMRALMRELSALKKELAAQLDTIRAELAKDGDADRAEERVVEVIVAVRPRIDNWRAKASQCLRNISQDDKESHALWSARVAAVDGYLSGLEGDFSEAVRTKRNG